MKLVRNNNKAWRFKQLSNGKALMEWRAAYSQSLPEVPSESQCPSQRPSQCPSPVDESCKVCKMLVNFEEFDKVFNGKLIF